MVHILLVNDGYILILNQIRYSFFSCLFLIYALNVPGQLNIILN